MSESTISPPSIQEEASDASAFAEMSVTPENHFALHFHAAVYAVLAYVRNLREQQGQDGDTVFDEYPFLARYLSEHLRFMPDGLTWEEGEAWWRTELRSWEEQVDQHLPLRALSTELDLQPAHRLAFVLAGLLEEDARFGTLFADLQAPVSTRRPTVELLGRIVQQVREQADGWAVCRPLIEARLLEVADRGRPRAEWALGVPFVLWEAARGDRPSALEGAAQRTDARHLRHAPSFDDLILPDDARERLRQVPSVLRQPDTRIAVVRGTRGSDRLAALDAVAREMSLDVVHVKGPDGGNGQEKGPDGPVGVPDRLGPFCLLTRSMPVLELDLPPGTSRALPNIPGYEGPVGVALSKTGGLTGEALDAAVTLSIGPLSAPERRRHWQAAFEATDANIERDTLDAIVDGFQLPGRYLRRAGTAAVRQAALDGRQTVTVADVRRATRSLGRQLLDTLAERIDAEGSWDHLVVDPRAEKKLRDLERRCYHRERLLDHLGEAFGSHTTKGVRALFAGPSGTGKTLAARILAAELGMDLYRVDLAAVINKYVGETEKNLHRVLSTAEELDVILLLDEGDALLGRRTEVATANDRYANVETNYLLQRLEHYRGIVLVTSNLADNIDPAFQRRMDLVVDFSPPAADERLAIWSIHLPADHAVSASLLRNVARECSLNGGQIRNAAMKATLQALDEVADRGADASTNGPPGDRIRGVPSPGPDGVQIRDEHVVAAVQDEYQKAGGTCPLTVDQDETDAGSGAQQFVEGMTS